MTSIGFCVQKFKNYLQLIANICFIKLKFFKNNCFLFHHHIYFSIFGVFFFCKFFVIFNMKSYANIEFAKVRQLNEHYPGLYRYRKSCQNGSQHYHPPFYFCFYKLFCTYVTCSQRKVFTVIVFFSLLLLLLFLLFQILNAHARV